MSAATLAAYEAVKESRMHAEMNKVVLTPEAKAREAKSEKAVNAFLGFAGLVFAVVSVAFAIWFFSI